MLDTYSFHVREQLCDKIICYLIPQITRAYSLVFSIVIRERLAKITRKRSAVARLPTLSLNFDVLQLMKTALFCLRINNVSMLIYNINYRLIDLSKKILKNVVCPSRELTKRLKL